MACRDCFSPQPFGTSDKELIDGDEALTRFRELGLGGYRRNKKSKRRVARQRIAKRRIIIAKSRKTKRRL